MGNDDKELQYIAKRLDQLIIILLAQSGMNEKEVAKLLKMGDKTVAKLVAGNFKKIALKKNE